MEAKKVKLFLSFFSLIFYHPLTPRVLPLFIICLELILMISAQKVQF